MRAGDRVEIRLGNVVLRHDSMHPTRYIEVTPAGRPVHTNVLRSAQALAGLIAFRNENPESLQDMKGINHDTRIREKLIDLRVLDESDTANKIVGYYQRLKALSNK